MKNKHKELKPINADVSLEYKCPSCHASHWLFLRETRTKGFRIVCECDAIIFPKTIKEIKIVYQQIVKEKVETTESIKKEPTEEIPFAILSERSLQECCKTLRYFGFDKKEAVEKITDAFENLQTDNIKELVNYVLTHIEEIN